MLLGLSAERVFKFGAVIVGRYKVRMIAKFAIIISLENMPIISTHNGRGGGVALAGVCSSFWGRGYAGPKLAGA